MSKSVTVLGSAAAGGRSGVEPRRNAGEERKDHLKVWRDLYRDVRRQWAEAESSRHQDARAGR